jgi:thiol-disulfide isomerase/thioredoxin
MPLVQIELKNSKGEKTKIKNFENYEATVLWFISPECPLCQNYTLTIKNIQQKYNSKIRFIGIVSGKDFTSKEIENFKKEYGIKIEILFDEEKKLVKHIGASITPEVFVYDKTSKLVYSGRIDNWAYAPGKTRTVITKHELADVLQKLNEGKIVPFHKTQAVGCFIE